MNQRREVEQQYTPEEIAELAKVSKWTVYEWINKGKFARVYKLGHRSLRIPAGAVNAFLEGSKVFQG
jgi:excisionase family DNA binding protein